MSEENRIWVRLEPETNEMMRESMEENNRNITREVNFVLRTYYAMLTK